VRDKLYHFEFFFYEPHTLFCGSNLSMFAHAQSIMFCHLCVFVCEKVKSQDFAWCYWNIKFFIYSSHSAYCDIPPLVCELFFHGLTRKHKKVHIRSFHSSISFSYEFLVCLRKHYLPFQPLTFHSLVAIFDFTQKVDCRLLSARTVMLSFADEWRNKRICLQWEKIWRELNIIC
jgi:hypothetical protein